MKYLHFYMTEYFLNRPIDVFRYSTDKERPGPAIYYSKHGLFSIEFF